MGHLPPSWLWWVLGACSVVGEAPSVMLEVAADILLGNRDVHTERERDRERRGRVISQKTAETCCTLYMFC